MISKNQKYKDTAPEGAFEELMGLLKIEVEHCSKRIWISPEYSLDPDYHFLNTLAYAQIDGEKFHSSKIQIRKDAWRDEGMEHQGLRVIHIPASLLVAQGVGNSRAFWPWVALGVADFLLSKETSRYLPA